MAVTTNRLPDPGLRLNCWVYGDRPQGVFPVKIAKDANIGDLRDLIKEKKPHAFQHVDADALDIWKVWPAHPWVDVADRRTLGRPDCRPADH